MQDKASDTLTWAITPLLSCVTSDLSALLETHTHDTAKVKVTQLKQSESTNVSFIPVESSDLLVDRGQLGNPCPSFITYCTAAGNDVYLGFNNGYVARLTLRTLPSGLSQEFILAHGHFLSPPSRVDQLLMLTPFQLLIAIADGAAHFLNLSNLSSVDHWDVSSLAIVSQIIIDESSSFPEMDDGGCVSVCMLRAASIANYKLGLDGQLSLVSETPLPAGIICARRIGSSVCLANSDSYFVLNLDENRLFEILPVCQIVSVGSENDSKEIQSVCPLISIFNCERCVEHGLEYSRRPTDHSRTGEAEFIIASTNNSSSMGFFISQTGEAVRGTLSWATQPRAISTTSHFACAILENEIWIHDLWTQEVEQKLAILDLKSHCSFIDSYPLQFSVLHDFYAPTKFGWQVATVQMGVDDKERAYVPENPSWPAREYFVQFAVFNGPNLLSLSLRSKAETLAHSVTLNKLDEIIDQLQLLPHTSGLVQFLHARAAFSLVSALQFEAAGRQFELAKIDSNLVISLFPNVRAIACESDKRINIFAGLIDEYHALPKDIIKLGSTQLQLKSNMIAELLVTVSDSVDRSYGEHFPLETKTGLTQDLERVLCVSAYSMLIVYLRTKKIENTPDPTGLKAINTALFIALVECAHNEEALDLLLNCELLATDKLQSLLHGRNMWYFSAVLHFQSHAFDSAADSLTGLLEGTKIDPGEINPKVIVRLLYQCIKSAQHEMPSDWVYPHLASLSVWNLNYAKRLLKRQLSNEDASSTDWHHVYRLLDKCSSHLANVYLACKANSPEVGCDPKFQALVFQIMYQNAKSEFSNQSLQAKCKELILNYKEDGAAHATFSSYLCEQYSKKEVFVQKALRSMMRLALFLQHSQTLDLAGTLEACAIFEALPIPKIIALGKMGQHDNALHLITDFLHDPATSEIYAGSDGQEYFTKEDQQLITTGMALEDIAIIPPGERPKPKALISNELVMILLRQNIIKNPDWAVKLLESKAAAHLNPFDVVELLPSTWIKHGLLDYLTMAQRKHVSIKNHLSIVKGLASGLNLQITEELWQCTRISGALIEEEINFKSEGETFYLSKKDR